ncbi:DM13 domain-containing protein [Fortiea contorta]|uniref:DM13 domain-containing protein n=1 Tax=Fortiea contorta TaxID=1892405 RepID=UPI000349A15D|nr:DM13 domain-containing protein [Fortiea contorta]
MKIQHLATLGIIAVISLGCTQNTISQETETQTPSAATTTIPVANASQFKAGEHPIQGKVSVITQQGKRYLQFDKNFKTSDGPDVYVILHRADAPPTYGIKEKDYVSLAKLQKTSGAQLYTLPNNVNLADFKSVAIWCRQFNATFGYAVL